MRFGGVRSGATDHWSVTSGAVIFLEPPHWEDDSRHQLPVLYVFRDKLSPLSQACIRGMKDTVRSLLDNRHATADDGYGSNHTVTNDIDILPVQIASAEYVGSRQQKYLNIVRSLVSFGANINQASFWTQEPPPQIVEQRNLLRRRIAQCELVLTKIGEQISKLEFKKREIDFALRNRQGLLPPSDLDQNEQLKVENDLQTLDEKGAQISNRVREMQHRMSEFDRQVTKKKMVNPSAYMMALRDRQSCNDTALIEAMVEGAIVIKDRVMNAVGNGLSEECVQIVVEFVIGLPLRLWDV